jgi:hypothetical protein
MRRRRRATAAAATFLLVVGILSACASSSSPPTSSAPRPSASPSSASAAVSPSTTYPNAVVVLGHSGTTGANTDPRIPGDRRTNSWATGENPAVASIYLRLLALNPAVRGRNTNLGVDGSDVNDLAAQVDQALKLQPLPDLFIVQEVDNDMRCDGSDPDNYAAFAQTLTAQLARIVAKAPRAIILLVSSPPGTVANYGQVVSGLQGPGREANTGTGPCDLFDPAGKAVPAHWRYQDRVIRHYQAQVAAVCKRFSTCRYDGGALYRMKLVAADLAFDEQHLSIAGHRKQAALEWKFLGLGS